MVVAVLLLAIADRMLLHEPKQLQQSVALLAVVTAMWQRHVCKLVLLHPLLFITPLSLFSVLPMPI